MNLHLPGDFRHAASRMHSRYAIAGAEVRRAGDDCVLVTATDGRVLATRLQEGLGPENPTIIPTELMPTTKAGGVISSDGDELRLTQGRGKVSVGEPADGAFPPIAEVIPEVSGVADLEGARKSIEKALEVADDLSAATVTETDGETLRGHLRDALSELRKSHHHVVGLSGQLLYNLARALNAGDGSADNLAVTLILPAGGKQAICVLPHGETGSTIGVLMPITAQEGAPGVWERRRSDVLDALDPERVAKRKAVEAKKAEAAKVREAKKAEAAKARDAGTG